MTGPDTLPDARHKAAWWLWTAGQAGVLAAYAAGLPPSGGYPRPVDATTDLGLGTAQLLLAALLGPALLGSPLRAGRAAAAGVPFYLLAVGLAGRPWGGVVATAAVQTAWLTAIGRARGATPQRLITILTVAGPLLWYIALEYGGRVAPLGAWPTWLCPVLGVASTRLHGRLAGPLAVPLLLAVAPSCVKSAAKPRPA